MVFWPRLIVSYTFTDSIAVSFCRKCQHPQRPLLLVSLYVRLRLIPNIVLILAFYTRSKIIRANKDKEIRPKIGSKFNKRIRNLLVSAADTRCRWCATRKFKGKVERRVCWGALLSLRRGSAALVCICVYLRT